MFEKIKKFIEEQKEYYNTVEICVYPNVYETMTIEEANRRGYRHDKKYKHLWQ